MGKDYYQILGVEKGSTKEEIKKAYKKLAKKFHPDLNKEAGSTDKFKEVNEAASVLLDEKKKAHYDRFGSADGFNANGFDFSGSSAGRGFGFDFDLGDMFEGLFGGSKRRRRSRAVRGGDIEFEITIKLEDAAFGMKKTINVPRMETCGKCGGSGAKSSSDIITCAVCNGTGMMRRDVRTPFGIFSQTSTCNECGGEGKTIKKACLTCGGAGRVRKIRKIEISVPAGISTGSRLRIAGEGEDGVHGGPTGDLYVYVNVKKHLIFNREGNDIYMELPISYTQAVLGAAIDVPTLKGSASLKIPTGTQCNTVFRMSGYGIPSLNGYGKGSQNIKVVIEVPKRLSKNQKTILKEFDKSLGKKKSFLESMFG